MSENPKRGEPLSLAQTLLVALTAIVAAGVGWFEFKTPAIGYFDFELGPEYRRPWFALPDDAAAMQPMLTGLMRAAPLVLLAAALCAAYAVFQKPIPDRRRALWTAFGLLLAFVALTAAREWLLYRVFIPTVDRGRFEHAQWVGTRTSLAEPAPDITVATATGETVRLADLRGSVVLLSFVVTGPSPCCMELPELQNLWNRFHDDDGFRMLAIGRGESIESVEKFGRENGFTFPLAADADRAAFDRFATEGVPRVYLISRDGETIFQCQGYHEKSIAALTTLLQAELARRE